MVLSPREPIDLVCPVPPGLSPVLLDRCLFSIAHQSYRQLHVSISVGRDAEGDVARIVDGHDWSRFPRKPRLVRYPVGPLNAGATRSFAIAQVEHRFFSVIDARATLYAQACHLLIQRALESRAAIVYGDTIVKTMRIFETFVYEEQRHYRGVAPSGLKALRAGTLPPLGACLLDGGRIDAADLCNRADGHDGDEAFVFRLLSRYPGLRIKSHVPISAHPNEPAAIGPDQRRSGSDRLMRVFRDLRRRLIAN